MSQKYVCPKCGNTQFESEEIRTTGGRFSKIFDIQNKKFTAVSCTQCKYTELYKGSTSAAGNIFDFFTN
ncbi:MAG: GTP-binding protein [Bacteroidetes bacterium 4572_77]|nr:MAG: GTP-binding protein [Bacteroidetes bacterium 4572_77]